MASDVSLSMAASRPPSPITPDDFELMKKTALFDHEDSQYLRMSYEVLAGQVEAVLDVWYGFVASHPHLLASFARKRDGQPDPGYLAGVRKRFGQWILDTAAANYDATWLSNQFEIGRRHHRTGKNQTDQVEAADHVPFRYLIPLIFPITHTLKPFLASKGHPPEQVDKMHQAWVKSLLLQVALWSQVYVQPGDF